MAAAHSRDNYANPPLEDDDLIDPDDGAFAPPIIDLMNGLI